jgi:hypothetical protein
MPRNIMTYNIGHSVVSMPENDWTPKVSRTCYGVRYSAIA